MSNRSLALHRTESRWHRRQMKSHDATFRRLNRSVHRRYPFAAPMADRAIHVPHAVHRAMGWGDGAFLGFHERFAGR